ncbi:RNA polymerase sigma factor [Coralliovum pocilloporae]|uniref:RNA polymerase sigma factor n=1 Tax=Coralliovum pocilloporae TaxID=3066369 RepID=UPI003306FC5B
MQSSNERELVSGALPEILPRLWRFAMVLSGRRDVADDLVQATCVRALERAHQFQPGTRIDRWTFTILSSIWKNQLRSEKIRQGQGFVDPEDVLVEDGNRKIEANIFLQQVLKEVQALPEAQRVTVLLVYVEGLSYREASEVLDIPIGTVMSRLSSARASLGKLAKDTPSASGRTRKGS